jgi:folylpolyglutamate synthase
MTRAIDPIDLVELKTQQALASAWFTLSPSFPPSQVHVLPSIEHAIKLVEQLQPKGGGASQILVTGSLHLVGGVIEVAGLLEVAI